MDVKKIVVYSSTIKFAENKPTIADLVVELRSIKAEYHRFGIQLRVPSYEIESWEQEFQRDADRMLEKILTFLFANQKYPMETLYAALKKIDQPVLADELMSKYKESQGN